MSLQPNFANNVSHRIRKGCEKIMAFCILRIEKIKSVTKGNARLKHNRREVECPTADKNKENSYFVCNDHSEEYRGKTFREIFKEKTEGQKIRKNAVHAVEILMTFSPGSIKEENEEEWARKSIEWVAKMLGGYDNIIDAQLHRDEKTTHIHAIVVPIDSKGKLNAREFLGGIRDRMSDIQTSYAKEMEKFGLERGISKKITKAQHKTSQQWHAENARKEARLQTYEEKFGKEKNWWIDEAISFKKRESEIEKELASGSSQTLSELNKENNKENPRKKEKEHSEGVFLS